FLTVSHLTASHFSPSHFLTAKVPGEPNFDCPCANTSSDFSGIENPAGFFIHSPQIHLWESCGPKTQKAQSLVSQDFAPSLPVFRGGAGYLKIIKCPLKIRPVPSSKT
ncbi:MAG: hypothetical protein ACK4Q5_08425, partial [Saprospiraceae bacterium]